MKTLLSVCCFLAISVSNAHPGGLDAKGGHYDRATGGYHVHRPKASKKAGKYWISSTGKTHNKDCRYFGVGRGKMAEKPSSVDCKICGGASRI